MGMTMDKIRMDMTSNYLSSDWSMLKYNNQESMLECQMSRLN